MTATRAFRVLVVDDDRDAADSLSQLLRMWGYDVRVAYDGPEAMEAVHAYRPDCVFSDIGLLGLDGYRLAEQVRQGITLVAVTADAEEHRSRAAGFDYNPADPLVVAQLVRQLHAIGELLERIEEAVQRQEAVVSEARELTKEELREIKEAK